MNIYFAGAIRAGREKVKDYVKIVNELENYGKVLTKHVANPKLSVKGDCISPEEIYQRDVKWLNQCDILFAEITVASLGVGYELAYAESLGKKVVCMYDETINNNVSGMILGNKNFTILKYSDVDKLLEEIKVILEQEGSK